VNGDGCDEVDSARSDRGVAVSGPHCRWSVVIPAYNEAARLPRYLREVVEYFDARTESSKNAR
jgi:hypothetical protein